MPGRFSQQQLEIMRVLWDKGSATVADVQQLLNSRKLPLAYTTIATVLTRMERKGFVRHRVEGRTYVYEPLVTEEPISKSLIQDLVARVFHGSPSQLVNYLLETKEVDHEELGRIKELLAEHEAQLATNRNRDKKC